MSASLRHSLLVAALVALPAGIVTAQQPINPYAPPPPPAPGTIQLPPTPASAAPSRVDVIVRDRGVDVGSGVIIGATMAHPGGDNRTAPQTVPMATVTIPTTLGDGH
jgi:hypothetical protein